METRTGIYGEDEAVCVEFTAYGYLDNCGERGAPDWFEVDSVEVEKLAILDIEIDFPTLRAQHPELGQAIYELHKELEFHEKDF